MEFLCKDDQDALQDIRDLIQINTVSALGPITGSYAAIADLLRTQCQRAGLRAEILELVAGKPILVATWVGSQPSLPSLLLTGHYDVVPAVIEKWSCDPFGGIIRDGMIYGRGTQDMKSCLAAYIHCVRRLKRSGFVPRRTVHLLFVPDEEIGGKDGMEAFVKTEHFRHLNVGFAIDEGLCSPDETVPIYFGERAVWWIRLIATGEVGHASTFIHESALQKLHSCLNQIYNYRHLQIQNHSESDLGDMIAINVTSITSGSESALNVIPEKAIAGVDIRIPATVNLTQFEKQLQEWTQPNGIQIEKLVTCDLNPVTSLQDNPWWHRLQESCARLNVRIEPKIFPAATDSRFLRKLGIPCLGFSPFPKTQVRFHDHDENISIKVYLSAIPIYSTIVQSLSCL